MPASHVSVIPLSPSASPLCIARGRSSANTTVRIERHAPYPLHHHIIDPEELRTESSAETCSKKRLSQLCLLGPKWRHHRQPLNRADKGQILGLQRTPGRRAIGTESFLIGWSPGRCDPPVWWIISADRIASEAESARC